MKLTKHIRYTVRVREYEVVQVEVGAEADHFDLGVDSRAWAELDAATRATYTDHLELMVISEVDKLARDELQRISGWSEIHPNLAQDFLHSATTQRNQDARTQTATPPSTSRRIRRSS